MARRRQDKEYRTFVGGLNTEANPLTFPENTARGLDNVDLLRDGSIRRRRGIAYEEDGNYSPSAFGPDLATWAISSHEWTSVDGNDNLNFLVLQIGGDLYFHDLGADPMSEAVIGKISLSAVRITETYANDSVSTASGKGKLFVVSPSISPAYIQYDQDANTFTGVKITVKIRDTDGIDEDNDSPELFGDDIAPTPSDPLQDIQDVIDNLDLGNLGLGGLPFGSFIGFSGLGSLFS